MRVSLKTVRRIKEIIREGIMLKSNSKISKIVVAVNKRIISRQLSEMKNSNQVIEFNGMVAIEMEMDIKTTSDSQGFFFVFTIVFAQGIKFKEHIFVKWHA